MPDGDCISVNPDPHYPPPYSIQYASVIVCTVVLRGKIQPTGTRSTIVQKLGILSESMTSLFQFLKEPTVNTTSF
jgi:hypothetical protein